jgi:DTW domain-containing protein YfiP
VVCLCAHFAPLETRTRVVILQHPREAVVPIGTARLAELGLKNAERHVGVDFAANARVRSAPSDPAAPPVLLYPGPDARDLSREPPAGPVTLVALDGTWWQAQKLFKKNPELARLPRYALRPRSPSRYRLRREPAAHCLSTIEALALALAELEGKSAGVERLLAPFDALVEQQLEYARKPAGRRHQPRPRAPRRIPSVLCERPGDVVVGYGEANAWPRETPLGAEPELVHFAAERVLTGERFEAFIAPRRPFAPMFTYHTHIPRELVLGGESWPSFCERWARFVEPGDVLCGWGYYASELLRVEGASVPERLDLRQAAQRYFQTKIGTVEQCAARFDEPLPAAWVAGRTGARLAALSAVARGLMGAARALSGFNART